MADRKKRNDPYVWRKERQDPDTFRKMEYAAIGLSVLSAGSTVGYVFLGGWQWYLLCLVWLIVPFVLDILYPEYFTLFFSEKNRDNHACEVIWPMLIHFLILEASMHNRNWLNENLFFLVAGLGGAAAAVILGTLAEEFRRKKGGLWIVCCLVAVVGYVTIGHINEAFDFSEPQVYILEVENLDRYGGRSTSYDCAVTLPDGRKVELDISGRLYNQLELGDLVRVEHSVGALGIEYANAYPCE